MTVLPGLDNVLSRLTTVHRDLLHVRLDLVKEHVFPTDAFEVVIELIDVPHVPVNDLCLIRLGVLSNGVVGQVRKLVPHFIILIVLSSEPDIALFVEPNGQGVPVGDQHPLSDVKLNEVKRSC